MPYDNDAAQAQYRKFKTRLTRAINAKDWPNVIAEADQFFAYYEDSAEPMPDLWSRWERARDDARLKIQYEARDRTTLRAAITPASDRSAAK